MRNTSLKVGRRLKERVNHLFTDWSIHNVTYNDVTTQYYIVYFESRSNNSELNSEIIFYIDTSIATDNQFP